MKLKHIFGSILIIVFLGLFIILGPPTAKEIIVSNADAATSDHAAQYDYYQNDPKVYLVERKVKDLIAPGQVGFIARDGNQLVYIPFDNDSTLDNMDPAPKLIIVERPVHGRRRIIPVPHE